MKQRVRFAVLSAGLLVGVAGWVGGGGGLAQGPPLRDPQAVALVNQALSALSGGTSLSDVTLTGTATWTAGSDLETGTFTLEGLGSTQGRVDLALSGGTRTEILNSSQAPPQGAWLVADGVWHAMALHNCWVPASWFFPALAFEGALNDPQVSLAYVGLEARAGSSVQHVQFARVVPGQLAAVTALTAQLSRVDVYLDPTSALPVALGFNLHPDDDAGTNIPVEIQYGDYQKVNRVQSAWHVQKLLQGSLQLDLKLTNAVINSGLSGSVFTIPTTPGA